MTMVVEIAALPPATSLLTCDDQRHRICWETGALLAPDHGDPEGERALAVLGGKELACLDVLRAWAGHRHDPRVLSVLTRGPGDPTHADLWRHAEDELLILAVLAGEVQERLVAAVTAHLLNELAAGDPAAKRALPALEVSLMARAKIALSKWSGYTLQNAQVEVVEEGSRLVVEEGDNGSLHAALPLRWVAEVWGRGLAVVGGSFCTALVAASPQRVVLEAIADDFESLHFLTLAFV